MTKIFHPNVAVPSGEICVNTLKKDWSPANWSLSHIFEVVKCLLIVPFPESSLNEEAGREFMENYDDFFNNARLYTSVHAKPTQI
jgi:ubiquitin-conjugating enzyme E2 S